MMGKNKKSEVTKEEMLKSSAMDNRNTKHRDNQSKEGTGLTNLGIMQCHERKATEKTRANSKQPLEKRGDGTLQGKEVHVPTSVDGGQGHKKLATPCSEYEDDWSSDEEIPEARETLTEDKELKLKTRTSKRDERTMHDSLGESKKSQTQRDAVQERTVHKEDKVEDGGTDQDTQKECSVATQMLKKVTKIDKSLMKALLALAAGVQEREHLLDRILTDFSKLKSLALEATHEIARLQGAWDEEQKARSTGPSYAEAVTGKKSMEKEGNQITDFIQKEDVET
ncbi:hypothetical protein MTO96_036559 [Rhipicephalus appendiculatus]